MAEAAFSIPFGYCFHNVLWGAKSAWREARQWSRDLLASDQKFRRVCAASVAAPAPRFFATASRGAFGSGAEYQFCAMVILPPYAVNWPNPEACCRLLDASPLFFALINGRCVPIDRVWTARPSTPITAEECAFGIGPLRRCPC